LILPSLLGVGQYSGDQFRRCPKSNSHDTRLASCRASLNGSVEGQPCRKEFQIETNRSA
jgi:hypothetical protein